MKEINAYRRWAGLVMVAVMSLQVFAGLRPFCSTGFVVPFRTVGIDGRTYAMTAADHNGAELSGGVGEISERRGEPVKCCCKKQAKCAAIPRAAITSNAAHRFNELQRLSKSAYYEYFVPQVTDHRLVARGHTPLLELASGALSHFVTPIELTCVLLI
jgi:hypothetical protein